MADQEYRTSDLYFAAYLRVAEIKLIDAVRIKGRVVFVFEDKGAAVMRDLKREYFLGNAKVSALTFVQQIRAMKTLTHQTE